MGDRTQQKHPMFVLVVPPVTLDPRMVSNSDGLPMQFSTMKNLHHMIYGTFNGKGFLVLLLQLDKRALRCRQSFMCIYILHIYFSYCQDCTGIWVSDKIRYDQSIVEPIGVHPKTIPKTIPSARFVQGAATAKPIGAPPYLKMSLRHVPMFVRNSYMHTCMHLYFEMDR